MSGDKIIRGLEQAVAIEQGDAEAIEKARWYCSRCKEHYTPVLGKRDYRCPHCLR